MATPKKNRYSGVMVLANQYPLSRVNSLSFDSDLNTEDIREIGNEEIVQKVSQTPTVSIKIETNEYDDVKNLRRIVGQSTSNIVISSFDGPTADIVVHVEEDNIYKRTAHINNATLVSLSYNFDVGGLATESFNLEGDNLTWYLNNQKSIRVFTLTGMTAAATTGFIDPWPWTSGGTAPNDISGNVFASGWVPVKMFTDGILYETGYGLKVGGLASYSGGALEWKVATNSSALSGGSIAIWKTGTNVPFLGSGGYNWRVVAIETGTTQTRIKNYPIWGVTDLTAPVIGGVSKGMIDIILVTGTQAFQGNQVRNTDFLRLQTLSIDVDLSRETLLELGHDRAFDKSLTLPVPVNLTFNALAADLEEYNQFAGKNFATQQEVALADFGTNMSVEIRIWNTKDTATTQGTLAKLVRVTGLAIATQSYGVDAGGNATQDFTATCSNILISGAASFQALGLGR